MQFFKVILDAQQVLGYEPVLDHETNEPKTNKDGHKKYVAQILCAEDGAYTVHKIKFDSEYDPLLTAGSKPTIENLRLMHWENGNKSGVVLLADSVATDGPGSSKTVKKTDTKIAV